MSYILRGGLSCCDVDGNVVFLDVKKDRYFRLPKSDEAAIRSLLARRDISTEQARRLVQAGVLIENPSQVRQAMAPAIHPPSLSALERSGAASADRVSVVTILEIMAILWSTKRQLRARSFEEVIDDTIRRKKAEADPTADHAGVLRAAAEFGRARGYVPIEPTCLLDSLSLVRFLSRRGLTAAIVFGVTMNPFAAHCWVQAGETVLNDTLSNAQSHTPIKMI